MFDSETAAKYRNSLVAGAGPLNAEERAILGRMLQSAALHKALSNIFVNNIQAGQGALSQNFETLDQFRHLQGIYLGTFAAVDQLIQLATEEEED